MLHFDLHLILRQFSIAHTANVGVHTLKTSMRGMLKLRYSELCAQEELRYIELATK